MKLSRWFFFKEGGPTVHAELLAQSEKMKLSMRKGSDRN